MKWNFSNQNGKKISVLDQRKKYHLDVADITHVLCNGYVCTFHTINEKNGGYCVARLLKQIEEELEEYGGFLRANHHTLVNTRYLSSSWNVKREKHIKIHDTEIIVSKRKAHQFAKI